MLFIYRNNVLHCYMIGCIILIEKKNNFLALLEFSFKLSILSVIRVSGPFKNHPNTDLFLELFSLHLKSLLVNAVSNLAYLVKITIMISMYFEMQFYICPDLNLYRLVVELMFSNFWWHFCVLSLFPASLDNLFSPPSAYVIIILI